MIRAIELNNQISYKAVNQKYLKWAQGEKRILNNISDNLIENLQSDILTRKLSPQDGIDTVAMVKKYAREKYESVLNSCIEMCKSALNGN